MRVPFCDHRLVEYVFGTPWSHTTFDGREKSLRDRVTQILSRGDDAPLAPLVDRNAVRERADSPSNHELNTMGKRMQLERIIELDAWLSDYGVELAV